MRDCTKCGNHTLDVTGEGEGTNFKFRCWNCGFECNRKDLDGNDARITKYENQSHEIKRLEWENLKLQEELVAITEKLKSSSPTIVCPGCKKGVKSTSSRVKVVEFIRNPKIGKSYENGAWTSRTLEQYHPKCWKKRK